MIAHDNLEDFRDGETYDLTDAGYADDWPLIEQWARTLGGPLLDPPCRPPRMASRSASPPLGVRRRPHGCRGQYRWRLR